MSETSPGAPPAGTPAAADWQALDGVDPAATPFPARVRLAGQDFLVLRIGEGFRGVQRTCPHQHTSLGDAALVNSDKFIRCAMHGYTFRLTDGKGINCPGYRIKVYDVENRAGTLFTRPAG
jgi:nitrite reductase/ring-hydroxylating ferredoxin subunit